MPSAKAPRPTLRSHARLRAALLGGSAICALALGGWGDEARASNMPTQGPVDLAAPGSGSLNVKTLIGGAATPGVVGFVSTGVMATVGLNAPRTLIDWTTFHVATGNTLNFTFGASAGDIVINRVAGGQVNVDAGGAVNGSFAGKPGGNIWFLAPNGVFLNGTVTASGVLSSNNALLADLNLLSDDVVTLKGELSAAGTLIDLSGVETTATGVVLDASGNIVLSDNIDTGATGVVNLVSQGTISQTSGAITAASISGSSVGGASLIGPNLFDTLGDFTNSGFGAVSINDAQPTGLTVSGAVNSGFANGLTLSASAGNLTIAAPLVFNAGTDGSRLNLSATGALNILQPVAIDGAGSVQLSYDASSPTNLSFQGGRHFSSNGSLFFNTANGATAPSSQGGSLSINGQSYTLLYNLALTGSTGPDTGFDDIAGIDANTSAGGDAGFYALATQVSGSGSPTSPQFGASLVGGSGRGFTGVFEGLGNAVVNLTISNTAVGQNIGLFAINSGVVRDLSIASATVSGGPGSVVSALVATNQGSVVQSDVGGSDISDGFGGMVGELVGINAAAGVITRGQADGSVTGGVEAGGLVGENDGAISGNSTANVRVVGDVNGVDLGGLVGVNTGTISQSAAAGEVTGAVNASNLVNVGGLVGSNTGAGSINQTLSAAAVNGGPGVAYAGGLVGYDNAAVSQSGALGPVTAPGGGAIGGLIGYKDSAASVSEVYATGAVTSGGPNIGLGPLSGFDSATQGNGSPIAFGYYDTLTTGLTSGAGTGLTTTQLQGVLPAGFNNQGPAWSTGPGLYPYITAIFPDGAQSVSGIVYGDAGHTPLGSGVNGAIPVHVTIDGGGGSYVPSTGANGYYFVFVDTGRFNPAGSTVLSWTTANAATASTDAAGVIAQATGTTGGLDIYGNSVLLPTTATTLSALEAGNPLGVTQFPTTPAFVSTQPIFVRAAGSGFDVDVAVNQSQGVTLQTTAPGAGITVNAPVALAPGAPLGVQSAGDLTLSNNLTADTVTLLAGGTLSQLAGVITAGTISGFGANGVSLTQANVFGVLGKFASGAGDLSITDAGAQGLTVSGGVSAGPGANLTLNATGGPLALNTPLLQIAGQLTLNTVGALAINAAITVEGAGSVVLSSNPPVSTNPTFDNGGVLTGGGPLTYATAAGLPATSSQGGALTINGQSTTIIYSGAGSMPTQGSVDLAVATPDGGALGVTTLQNGAPTPGSVSYNSTGSAASINLQAPRTLIDWTTFTVGPGNTLNFNFSQSAADIVVNRIASGAITVGVGGSVNGFFQGAPGGAVWFLAPGGVFLEGTVTAAGVLAGSHLGLPDLNLLSDPLPTLKGELAAGATLIDLTGAVTASGVAIDASQNIILSGIIDTGPTGAVSLFAQGTVTQAGGPIQTPTLAGSSIGGATLADANLINTLTSFTNYDSGSIKLTNAQSLAVTGAVDNTQVLKTPGTGRDLTLAISSGDLTGTGVFTSERDVVLTGSGNATLTSAAAGGDLVILAGGSIGATGALTTTNLVTAAELADPTRAAAAIASAFTYNGHPLDPGGQSQLLVGAGANGMNPSASLTIAGQVTATGALMAPATGSDAYLLAPGALTVAGVTAGRDILLAGSFSVAAPVTASGALVAGRDIAVTSSLGATTVLSAAAGDDVVVSGQSDVNVTGNGMALQANGSDPTDAYFVANPTALQTYFGHTYTNPGATDVHIGVKSLGGNVTIAGMTQALGSPDYDVRVAAAGAVHTGDITTARDVVIQAGASYDSGAAPTNVLTAQNGDVAVLAGNGNLTLTSASAGDDVVLRAPAGALTVSGGLVSGRGAGAVGAGNYLATYLPLTIAGVPDTAAALGSAVDIGAESLAVSGSPIVATGGNLVLYSSAAADLSLATNVMADASHSVILFSGGAITQRAGIITAGTLTVASNGGATLNDQNLVGALGGFTNGGAGTLAFTDAIPTGLTITGGLNAGAGDIDLTTTAAGAPLTLAANLITGGANTVDLISAGAINQFAGAITTGTLTGSSVGGAVVTSATNSFDNLGAFTNSGVGNVSIIDSNADGNGLTVTGAADAGAGNTLTLSSFSPMGVATSLVLSADITAAGGTVSLNTAGGITQTAGIITTGTLIMSVSGGASLTDPNLVSALGGFTNTGTSPLMFVDAIAAGLMVTGELNAGGSDIDLTTTGGPLSLAANLTTSGANTVDLVSAGPINQTTSIITTGNLTGSSVGGASFSGANFFDALAGFSNLGVGNVSIVDARMSGLTVSGAVDAGAGNTLTLTTTNGGPLTLAANLTAAGGTVNLISAGSISQTAGIITSATLAGSSVGGATLTDANLIGDLAGFTNSSAGAVSLADAVSLSVSGVVDNTAGPPGAGRDIGVTAPGLTGAGVFTAARDIALNATTGSLDIASATAGRDIVIDAAGSFGPSGPGSTNPLAAGRDVAIRSQTGSLALGSISAGDDVVLVAPAGAVDLNGAVTASGSAGQGAGQTLFSTVSAPLAGLFVLGTQSIFIGADTYVNAVSPTTGAPSMLTATNGVGIALTDASGLKVADADPPGSWVQPATLSAPTVSLFETGGPITVRDATISGPITALNLYTPGQVLVTGVLAPAVDNAVSLAIGAPDTPSAPSTWSPSQIEVINDGLMAANHGAIGAETVNAAAAYSATPRTFNAVLLYATSDILLGTQAFIAANAAITDPAQLQQIDPNQPFPAAAANTTDAVLLAAGDLSLAAGRMIVQQDTAGLMTTNGVGTYVTRTLSLDSVGPNPPPAIDVFGAFVSSGQTTPVAGTAAAFSNQLRLSQRLSLSGYRRLYRLNTATISPGNSPVVTVTTIPADPTTQGSSVIPEAISIDSGDAIGQLGGFDVVSRSSSHPSVAFSWLFADGFVRYQDTDVEDLTATGAPNEEIWRTPD